MSEQCRRKSALVRQLEAHDQGYSLDGNYWAHEEPSVELEQVRERLRSRSVGALAVAEVELETTEEPESRTPAYVYMAV